VNRLRRMFCHHLFRGCDMGRRDESGKLDWACHKCGKVYRFDYGLQANDVGTITGPWGHPTKEADK
jgi:RNase P subunit RPR2